MAKSAQEADPQVLRFDQSDALLRKVMESAAVGMTLVGVDGRMIYVNGAYEAMLGFRSDESLGMQVAETVFEDDRAAVMLQFDRVMRGELQDLRLECRMRHRDGGPLWALASVSLLRSDVSGRPLYAVVQLINIDRQKRAERALAESESRWNYALESAGQGVWDHDVRRDDMFYSRMWRRMRGISDDEYVDPAQDKWLERVHPDDVSRILATVKKQDHGIDGYDTLEYRERHRDGHWIWILSRGKPVEWDADGNPLRTIGTDTDITRLKLAESQVAQEKERLRVTLHSIGEGVISTDAEARVTFMNPVAEAMTGWAEAEAFGRPVREVFTVRSELSDGPPLDHAAICLAAERIVEIGEDAVLESRDGTSRGLSGTAAPVRAQEGQIVGAVLVFKDATDSQNEKRLLTYSANHDVLTGLPNRAAFCRALAEACQLAAVQSAQYALCFVDLDRFKHVNDRAGHAAGDALLQQVAQTILNCCRTGDFAARLGGDEFVLLLAGSSQGDAQRFAQSVVDAIAAIEFTWNGETYAIGASAGVAPFDTHQNGDPLAAADQACYAAKRAGRGRIAVATVGSDRPAA
ncbi:MAG TPA: PAS domain S-box protein [Devosia sp.]|nr:PAS domain S-box protein [Devosia sp.]